MPGKRWMNACEIRALVGRQSHAFRKGSHMLETYITDLDGASTKCL